MMITTEIKRREGVLAIADSLLDVNALGKLQDLQASERGQDGSVIIEAFAPRLPEADGALTFLVRRLNQKSNHPLVNSVLDAYLKRKDGPATIHAFAMRFGMGVDGIEMLSSGVAVASTRLPGKVQILHPVCDGEKVVWGGQVDFDRYEGSDAFLNRLIDAEEMSALMRDERWRYQIRGDKSRSFAYNHPDAQLFVPSGIKLNYPGKAIIIG